MMGKKPRILAIVEACPCAEAQGARIRAKGVLDLLARIGDLSLILTSRWTHDQSALDRTRARYNLQGAYTLEYRPVGWKDRLSHDFNPRHLNTHNAGLSETSKGHIFSEIKRADLVWFHTVIPANALGITSLKKAILDVDDVSSRVHLSAAARRTGLARLAARRRAKIWCRREQTYPQRFGTLVVCSEDDQTYLGGDDVFVLPNGFDQEASLWGRSGAKEPLIGFVGNLTYQPNREGLQWFLSHVWHKIKASHPNCRMRVVGRGGEAIDWSAYRDVTYLSWIEELTPEMQSWALTIVPIWEGGGTRIKIATAFSMNCPVVSTGVGAFGYHLTHRRELLIANTEEDFAASCSELLTNRSLAVEIADRAYALFESSLTWASMQPKMEAIVESALETSRSEVSSTYSGR